MDTIHHTDCGVSSELDGDRSSEKQPSSSASIHELGTISDPRPCRGPSNSSNGVEVEGLGEAVDEPSLLPGVMHWPSGQSL